MENKKIKIGLIGIGRFGKFHLTNLLKSPFELIGIFDSDMQLAKSVADEFGVEFYECVDELIKESDAIDIVVPTSMHLHYAEKALALNKHIFIEKPIASSAASVHDFIKKVSDAGIAVQVGHIERFNPAYMAANEAIEPPYLIESKRLAPYNPRANDVSVIHDLMIHDIDAILALVKSPVSGIKATGSIVLTNHIDICEARIEFENGCVANLMASRMHTDQERYIQVFKDELYMKIDFLNKVLKRVMITEELDNEGNENELQWRTPKGNYVLDHTEKNFPPSNAILDELNEFYNSIVNDKPTRVDQHDAFQALLIADNIQEVILGSKGLI